MEIQPSLDFTSNNSQTRGDIKLPLTSCQRKRTVCRRRGDMTEAQLKLKRQQDRDAQSRKRQRIRESNQRMEHLEKVVVEMKRELVAEKNRCTQLQRRVHQLLATISYRTADVGNVQTISLERLPLYTQCFPRGPLSASIPDSQASTSPREWLVNLGGSRGRTPLTEEA
ncbi:hypothetical protein M409DRAFT_61747 [Zasmidium cellare ATCC 36951]|uniref:BZIP domain-containing protein n=1 Tax=Zasmidium cellare ATCC 36951 TaxID=1080233 RepID=A0A6A6BWC5_ZASCE|nr:uncharacterized protein M409DRAFT_61747 [Zasmidium cellare ATCC 36951]KAF2158338.1 hypothetical protein M409DRAFT_61747 [Zasmidium cellare ATCC 36951]